jgi:hypothetical protein
MLGGYLFYFHETLSARADRKIAAMKHNAKSRALRAVRQIIRAARELTDIEKSQHQAVKRKAPPATKGKEADHAE